MEAASFFVFPFFCPYYILKTKKIQRTARPLSQKIQDLDAPKKRPFQKLKGFYILKMKIRD